MRFNRFALSAIALIALSASQGFNGVVHAEEETEIVADSTPAEGDAEILSEALANGEKFEFQAEVSRILDIVVNSLYQNKDVFLRELISNASDAIDKMRFLSIQNPEMLGDKKDLEVRISYDEEAKTLTISDSGIGMTKDDLVANLGTVARSGTSKFMDALQEGAADISQIGMFGVGFYSAYLVADKVTVASKNPNDPNQHIWTSNNGQDSFTVAEDPRGNSLGRGTEITLHLKDDAEEYADFNRLKNLVNHYSEFITHPIYVRKTETMEIPDEDDLLESSEDKDEDELDVGEEEDSDEEKPKKMKEITTHSWEKSNADSAIWNRSKDDVTDEEYQEFWKLIGKDGHDATTWSHFDAEGNINFKSLVYLPSEVPFSMKSGDFANFKNSVKLYVRKVLISDEFELLPRYLSFVKGVVDSEDLPLNVNRETLQESKIIAIIRKKVTRKVLDLIKKLADTDPAEDSEAEAEVDADGNVVESEDEEKKVHPYNEWYEKFHVSLKMGIMDDDANRNRIAKLIRVKTSTSEGEWTSFADYVSRMKEWQKQIFFISGSSQKEVEESPFMEKFLEKDVEVIYFTDPADEYMVQRLNEFDGKKFSIITKDNIKFGDEDEDLEKRITAAYTDKFKPLTKFMNKFYGGSIMSVKISKRLGRVPAICSSTEYGNSANMERIMRAQVFAHQEQMFMTGQKTLEINPRHPFITKILEQIPEDEDFDSNDLSQEFKDSLWNLLDTALLSGGFPIKEGKAFNNRMIRTLKAQLDVESMTLLPEIEPKAEEDVPPEPEFGEGLNMDDFNIEDFVGGDDLDEFDE